MKKYITYIGILVGGILLGWFLFSGSSGMEKPHNHEVSTETNQMWTCSMHPQIMQPEPGNCPICGMDLIPAKAGADGLDLNQFKLTENALALANIQTNIVGGNNVSDNAIMLSGKIIENEESNAVQVSYFSGRIERLNVNFTGEEIRKGQLLATIYSPELYAAQQELITATSLKESQPKLYKAVRNKLKLWKLSENQINKIETTGKVLDNFPVYATVSGTVTKKMVEQGDYIKQGQALLKIANLNTVWANFDVYESQIDLFKKGQEVKISTNAFPDKKFNGKVSFIDPVLDTKTRTVKLRVVLNNTNNIFKPGMFVEGKVEGTSLNQNKEQSIRIPASAVLWTGKRSVVYVKINPSAPIFEMREIKLGNALGENYEVLSGLDIGAEIVTNGTFTVDAAAQLQGKKSMMNQRQARTKISENEQESFQKLIQAYFNLKNAFVNDDVTAIEKSSNIFTTELKSTTIPKELTSLEEQLNIIQNSNASLQKEKDIEKRRMHFIAISENMVEIISLFDGFQDTIFVLKCPMANNNEGARWLSNSKAIENPYFGAKMLTCGEVIDVIQ